MDGLAVDVLTKVMEFVPFEEVHTTVKRVSRGLRSAARRALTKGRWRPLKFLCARGRDELFGAFLDFLQKSMGIGAEQLLANSRNGRYPVSCNGTHCDANIHSVG